MSARGFYAGRHALVVGGSQGIGRSIADALVLRGCHVIVAARGEDRLEEARQALSERASGVRVATIVLDVRDSKAVRSAIDGMAREEGAPDLVFNCAGLARPGWVELAPDEALHEMMQVNCFGTVAVCRAVLPHMRARGSGVVVNVASLAGLLGLRGYTGYCASKFAVVGFTEALRREVADAGISVSLLCPPNTRTPGLERENREKPPEVLAQEQKVRVVAPEVVARYLLEALPRRPAVVIPTLDGRVAWWLARWAPGLLDRLLAPPRRR